MVDNIETDTKEKEEQIKLIYRKLPHRGPLAFHKLLEILKDCHFDRAFNLLSQSTVQAKSYSNIPVVTEDNRYLSISNTANLYRQNSTPSPRLDARNNNTPSSPTQVDGSLQSKAKIIKLEPYTTKTSFNIENLEVKKAEDFGKHPLLPIYSMRSKRRGVFFFANIIEFQDAKTNRRGAERDHDNMCSLFR